jgi:hypothetical protein
MLSFLQVPLIFVRNYNRWVIMYERFMQLLQKHGITAYRVAKETGVTQTTLSDWKTGRAVPRIATLQKIADYFNVSLDWLMGKGEMIEEDKYSVYPDIKLVARHLENIPEKDRAIVVEAIEKTIDMYLKAKNGNKED